MNNSLRPAQVQQSYPIYFEERPLIALVKECNHPAACYIYLRQIYVIQDQESVSNYPLQCYHSLWTKIVRDTQLTQYKLIKYEKEL